MKFKDNKQNQNQKKQSKPIDQKTNQLNFQTIATIIVLVFIYSFLITNLPWDLILSPTMVAGGDTGSHNYLVYYSREIFPKIKWWSADWYAGFPFLYFYPPLLYYLTTILSFFIDINIAFKLITLLGTLLFPLAVYFCLKKIKAPFPTPLLGAVLSLSYLFLEQFSMYGGNLPSTLAGEFSYSFAFSLFFIFWASLMDDIKERKKMTLNAIILSLMVLSHPFPVIVSLISVFLFLIGFLIFNNQNVFSDKQFFKKEFLPVFWYLFKCYLLAFCLTAFWSLPFLGLLSFTSKMSWTNLINYQDLFPSTLMLWEILGIGGIILAIFKKENKLLTLIFPLIGSSIFYFFLDNSSIWNTRFLPFILVSLLLFAAFCLKEIFDLLSRLFLRGKPFKEKKVIIATNLLTIAFSLIFLTVYLPKNITYIDDWLKWNYEGFEKKPGYPQLKELGSFLESLPYGRIMWEYRNEYDQIFGTPRVLENLPIWTKKPTFEGLLIESSLSGNFHFLNQAETTLTPSSAIAGLEYPPFNFPKGVEHLKLFGAQYFVAYTPEVKNLANQYLKKIKELNDFSVYEIENSEIVEPVKQLVFKKKDKNWLETSTNWYLHQDLNQKIVFYQNEKEKQEIISNLNNVFIDKDLNNNEIMIYSEIQAPKILSVEKDKISFEAEELGIPYIVKISYFPGWQVKGGNGPYLISPSFMMIIPSQKEVTLEYHYNLYDQIGFTLSGLSLGFLIIEKLFRSLRSPQHTLSRPQD